MREKFYAIQKIGKLTEFAPTEIPLLSDQLKGYQHNRKNQKSLPCLSMLRLSVLRNENPGISKIPGFLPPSR